MTDNDDNRERLAELVEAGAEIAGELTGPAVGFFLGGVPGVIIGAAAQPLVARALTKVGSEISRRYLGPQERKRVGATVAYAASKLQKKLQAGERLRDDDFFDAEADDRAAAEEVIEGVLLIAQREYQERKLSFIGNLLANILLDPRIDRPLAVSLIRLAERLSYRQLCLVALFRNKPEFGLSQQEFVDRDNIGAMTQALMHEVYDLAQHGLIPINYALADGPTRFISPHGADLSELGNMVYLLMELWEIDVTDRERLAALYRAAPDL